MANTRDMTQDNRPIVTPDNLNTDPQYRSFVLGLQRCWDLTAIVPENLVWSSEIPKNTFYRQPADSRVSFRDLSADPRYAGTPDLSVVTFPVYEVAGVPKTGREYTSPLIVEKDGVKSLGQTQLPAYEIKWDKNGRLFETPRSFGNILKDEFGVTADGTPVLEAVAFLPVSGNAPTNPSYYQTHFLPRLTSAERYAVNAITEDRMPKHGFLTPVRVHDTDEDGTFVSFQISYVPTMSRMEREMLATHHGHMLFVTRGVRVREPKPTYVLPFSLSDYGPMLGGMKGRPDFGRFGLSRESHGADFVPRTEVGDTSIGSGRETGDRFKKAENVEDDPAKQSVVIHLKTVGVKRLASGGLSEALLEQLFTTKDHFPLKN